MNLPSREECEGWDQAKVAFLLYKNNMQECAVTVNRLKINGQRFLNLSESDLSKFSLIHQPQLQKIVQDIKKNDGSFLNKLKRLTNKPVPTVPARDYRDDHRESDDQLSDSDYDNDTYEDPRDDDSYEPPPSHRVFTAPPSGSFPRGEYVDSPPKRPPKKPLRPTKFKELPPEPPNVGSDEEDYINPEDNDNYIEPSENPSMNSGNKATRDLPKLPQRTPSPDFYEVPDKEDNSPAHPGSRLCPTPAKHSSSLPPKPSPRVNMRKSPTHVQETTDGDEYEVCDPDDSPGRNRPPRLLKPIPRERSPKPPLGPRPDLKAKDCESKTLPLAHNEQKTPPKAFTLDFQRPKIPIPQFTSPKPHENDTGDQDKDADIYRKPWYASGCDRKTADDALFRLNKDGAFMVRKSSGHDAQQPYTLVVFYNGRVYNIPIRYIPSTQQYALGREKKGEEHFSSISKIIENHQRNPLVLIDSQSNAKEATKLCYPVKP
nr:B-cell linker protein isoform X1 [Maylandia zebra]